MADQEHRNNFEALRIIAACAVLFDHQFALYGAKPTFFILNHSVGECAVEVFFAVSGYLVAQSWHLDPQPLRFLAKRVLRIWPALFVVLLLSVLVLGPVMTSVAPSTYWSDARTRCYLTCNLRMQIVYFLPGVFETNPYHGAVNGSLWTLPYEVCWYLILAAFGLVRILRHRWLTALIWAAMFIYYFFIYRIDGKILLHGTHLFLNELGLFFMGGVVLQSFGAVWRGKPVAMVTGLATVLALSALLYRSQLYLASKAVSLPVLAIWFGSSSLPLIRRAGRWGDPSYGIYIYAFVVQQTLVALMLPRWGFVQMLMASMCVTVALGYLSWHLVEKPSLRLKSRLALRRAMPPSRFALAADGIGASAGLESSRTNP